MARNMVDIVVNAQDRASQTLRGVGGAFDSLAGKAQKASGIIMSGLAITGAGLGAIAVAGAKYNAMLETSDARWKTLTGSVEGANKQMDFISTYAKSSPFDYEGIDQTATALNGMGLEIKDVNSWIPTLGDMASVMGGGTETVLGVGRAIGQINAKGKVSAEEMMQLAERGVNGWGMIADGMGLTVAEVQDLGQKGKLLAKDALPLIKKGMEEAFGGGTETYMKSAVGQFAQIQEGAMALAGSLTSGAYEFFGTTVLPTINRGLNFLTDAFSGGLLSGFQNLWNHSTTAKVVLMGLASVITGMLVGALFLIGPAVVSATIAFAPFVAIGAVIAGLAYLIMNNWSTFKPYFENIWNGLKSTFETLKNALMSGWGTLTALWEQYSPAIFEKLQTLWEGLKGAWSTVSTFLSNGWTTLVTAWNTNKPVIFDNIKTMFENLKTAFEVTKTALIDGWAWVVEMFNTKGSALNSTFEVLKSIWNGLKTAFEQGKLVIASVADNLSERFSAMKGQLVPIFEQLKTVWGTVKELFATAIPVVKFLASVVGAVLGVAFTVLMGVISGLVRAFAPLLGVILTLVDYVLTVGKMVLQVFQGDFAGAMESSKRALSLLGQAVLGILNTVLQFFLGFVQGVWAVIRPFATQMVDKFKVFLAGIATKVMGWVAKVIQFFGNLKSKATSLIGALASWFVAKFVSFMASAREKVSTGVSNIIKFFTNLKSTATSLIGTLASVLVRKFINMMNDAKNKVSSGISAVVQFFQGLKDKVTSKIESLRNSIKVKFMMMMNEAKTKVTEGVSNMIEAVKNFGTKFLNAGKGLITALGDGIKAGINVAKSKLSDGMGLLRNLLPGSDAKEGPLSDLTKSGKALFPTWYNGALKEAPKMARKIGGAMTTMNKEMSSNGSVGLEAFTGGRSKVTVVHRHEHSGAVQVNGDNSRETMEFMKNSMTTQTEETFTNDLRRVARSR